MDTYKWTSLDDLDSSFMSDSAVSGAVVFSLWNVDNSTSHPFKIGSSSKEFGCKSENDDSPGEGICFVTRLFTLGNYSANENDEATLPLHIDGTDIYGNKINTVVKFNPISNVIEK